jgi:hypothetical protein
MPIRTSALTLLVALLTGMEAQGQTWGSVGPGVEVAQWNEGGPRRISAARIDLCAAGVRLHATSQAARGKRTSTWASANRMLVAINSGFFLSGYKPHGVAAGDGRLWTDSRVIPDTGIAAFGAGRIGLYNSGTSKAWESWMTGAASISHLVLSGGRNVAPTGVSFTDGGHPRTVIGVGDGGRRLYFVVVDGRSSSSVGASMRYLGDLLKRLGATDAANLDGGGSSTFWVSGRGVINRPSDGSERTVSNHFGVTASGSGSAPHCPPTPPPPPPPPPQGRRFEILGVDGTFRGEVGQLVSGVVRLKNTGTVAWSPNTRLAPLPRDVPSPLAGPDWLSPVRISAPSERIEPGKTTHLPISWRLPDSPGVLNAPFTLVEENAQWFGDALGPVDGSATVALEAVPKPQLRAEIVSIAPAGPVEVGDGEVVEVELQVRNTGSSKWTDGQVMLAPTEPRGRASAFAHPDWLGADRVTAFGVTAASPGTESVHTARFRLRAPRLPGQYVETFGLVTDDGRWFSDDGGPSDAAVRLEMTVRPPPELRARILEVTPDAPVSVAAGDELRVRLKVQNTGSASWPDEFVWVAPTGPRRRESPLRHPSWPEDDRAAPLIATTQADQSTEFSATVRLLAPPTPGRYAESFGLVTSDGRWFSDGGGPEDEAIRLDVLVTEKATPPSSDEELIPVYVGTGCRCAGSGSWDLALSAVGLALLRRRRNSATCDAASNEA